MSIELENGDYDSPLVENIKERREYGTHLAAGAAQDALRVEINGDGSLGTGGKALVVRPGTGQVAGTEHTIASGDTRTLDVALPRGNDRRDVVYLSDAGTLEVQQGRGGSFEWGANVAANARTFANAAQPAPPDLHGVPGLVLAIVTIQSGQQALQSDGVWNIDVGAPTAVDTGRTLTANTGGATAQSTINDAAPGDVIDIEAGAAIAVPGTLRPAQGVTLRSSGERGASATLSKAADGPLIECSHWVELDGLRLDGNRGGNYSGVVIDCAGSRELTFRNLVVEQGADDGIRAQTYLSSFESVAVRNNGEYGIHFPDAAGENPHNALYGPCYIGFNDRGGIRIDGDGKNTNIHAWIGDNGGPGIHATGTWRTLRVMGQIAANDGPAWLQDGGSMRASLENCLFQGNAKAPDAARIAPLGEIHIESGILNANVTNPWVYNPAATPSETAGGRFISAPSANPSNVTLVTNGGGAVNGDIEGANLALAVTDASVLSGSVDVDSAIALDSGQEAVRTGPTLSNTAGGGSDYAATATQATLSADGALSSGAFAQVSFDATNWGSANFDTSAGRYTAPGAGLYHVSAGVDVAVSTTSVRVGLRAVVNPGTGNESTINPAALIGGSPAGYTGIEYGREIQLAAGDTLELRGFQDSGSARVIDASSTLTVRKQSGVP